MPIRTILLAISVVAVPSAFAQELRVYPPTVTIAGPNALQQLVVVDERDGRAVADRTSSATFATSDAKVATVDVGGTVAAVGDGEATVTATHGGRSATTAVRVARGKGISGWSFRNHVIPTLTRTGCNSGSCHGALAGKGGFKLSLRGYAPTDDFFAMTRQAGARRTDGGRPEESLFLKKAVRSMPHGGGRRIEDDGEHYRMMLEWVRQGAPEPSSADPALARIEVFPRAALSKVKDRIRVVVRAVYADGRMEDVSRLARFGSTEDQVAAVDEDGVVTVAGHGEAAVTVGFGSRVAVVPITSPFPHAVEAAAYERSPRNNFIDGHVLAKLRLLNLKPSDPCGDAEFVRRAFLDTCGSLPKSREAAAFVADPAPDKRARLVESLLARKEYVDYWAYRWSDLLLVSSRRLAQPAMWAFYRSVRQAVADNRPWDRFARDVLTASGDAQENGAANYFVLHKDTSQLAEATAVTFLGTSIACAKCHNHPLEKWTQDQYWAFANLFARIGLKAGERPGEVSVVGRPDGDALHLRRGTAMPPAPLDARPLALDDRTDRRAYFADWLTAPENPFFARAFVNRVWRNFMGRGLVETEDDLRETNPPSNAELLDALAKDFVGHGFDVKHLIRTIVGSAAYQRSSRSMPENVADDRYYSRYLLRRLPAEVILDAYSDVTGVPTPFNVLSKGPSGGVADSASYPVGTRAMELPDSLLVSRFLEAFGRAERVQTCACERTQDTSVAQALHLNNGQTLNDKLRAEQSIVSRWVAAGTDDGTALDELYSMALSRSPTASERAKLLAILGEGTRTGKVARREALEDLVWATLTGREFLFNH